MNEFSKFGGAILLSILCIDADQQLKKYIIRILTHTESGIACFHAPYCIRKVKLNAKLVFEESNICQKSFTYGGVEGKIRFKVIPLKLFYYQTFLET